MAKQELDTYDNGLECIAHLKYESVMDSDPIVRRNSSKELTEKKL